MSQRKNLLLILGEWWESRESVASQPADRPSRWGKWLPTPGTVLFTLVVIIGLLWAQNAGALTLGAPSAGTSTGTIAYQGRLADSAGNPLTEILNMSFRLYSGASGGAALWTEQWTGPNGVQVSDGLFNVMLGSLTPIAQSLITGNSTLFLGITVGTDDEMSPRVQLGSVPFAVQALTVPDGSITAAKLAADVSLIPPDGSITTAKLANGAVTEEKLGFSMSSVQIQSGRIAADMNGPGWSLHLGSGPRSFVVSQTFAKPFTQTPAVVVSISHTDSAGDSDRIVVSATNVTTSGFDVVFHTWAGTKVYGTTASWIAYTSP